MFSFYANSYQKKLIQFVFIFLFSFAVFYYGTTAIIGLCSPVGKYYSHFADTYLDYVTWIRFGLLNTSYKILNFIGYKVYLQDIYTIKFSGGRGVHVGYSCIGYGLMSFWAAFIIAAQGKLLHKLKWLFGGLLLIFFINTLRIAILLIAVNKEWKLPIKLDSHTWFNIIAYSIVLLMIYFFDRQHK